MRSRIDLSEKVTNADRRFGAAPEYYPATIIFGNLKRNGLFTPRQISDALARGKANPEDFRQRPGLMDRIKAWFARW